MSAPVLITGFGPFGTVTDNPSARVARTLDGAHSGRVPLVGEVLPVTYRTGPMRAVARARELGARAVVGLGVARGRDYVAVERIGRRLMRGRADTDGDRVHDLGPGPDEVPATLDPDRLAMLLGAQVSDDAGGYVCDAWAWHVPQHLDVPAVFVHVPVEGLDPERLRAAIALLIEEGTLPEPEAAPRG